MFRRLFLSALALAVAGITMANAPGAEAAVLGVYSHDYGRGANRIDPQGDDTVRGDHVIVQENRLNPFYDSFDFSDLSGKSIDSFTLEIDYAETGPYYYFGLPVEQWYLAVGGSNAGGTADDLFSTMMIGSGTLSMSISAASDAGGADVFSTALSSLNLGFWFTEPAFLRTDTFLLYEARLTVNGSDLATVPLPAPGLLLLAGLGGLGAMRRFRGSGSRGSRAAPAAPSAAQD